MAKRLSYEEVKNYIEVESNSGCKLLSTEYKNNSTKLEIQCKCGKVFFKSFGNFQKVKINQCELCAETNVPKNKKQNDEINLYIKSLGYILVSEYKSYSAHLIIKDDIGFYYKTTFGNLKKSFKPSLIHKSNPYSIENIKLWLIVNNKPFKLISDKYINDRSKLIFLCLKDKCRDKFKMCWADLYRGSNCPVCRGIQVGVSNCLATKNPELAKQWHPTKNGDLTPYDIVSGTHKKVWWQCKNNSTHEWNASIANRVWGNSCPYCAGQLPSKDYNLLVENPKLCKEWNYEKNDKLPEEYTPKSSQKVWWKCKDCGCEWQATINKRNVFGRGCPKCNESKGEKRINTYLLEYFYPYEREYTFLDLIGIGGGLLRFDTAIFWDKNKTQLRLLIEYDGGQHFYQVKEFQSKYSFETLKLHDKMKDEYCIKNNIKLLRIPYYEFENIEKILHKELKI